LEEIVVRAYAEGYRIEEIPFEYTPRKSGKSKMKLSKFARDYFFNFLKMWYLRNSINCCDYDDRAYDSKIFLQRWWQRKRKKIIYEFISRQSPDLKSAKILDIGCGSSRIIQELGENAVGIDRSPNKLRFLRRKNIAASLTCADISSFLPFPDESFEVVILPNVIEHLSNSEKLLKEIWRILRKDGRLIVATPDYSTFCWKVVGGIYEHFVPFAYGDEHIARYTFVSLKEFLASTGFVLGDWRYICRAELIVLCRKNN
jgi:SAM-dependent methyltransferase